MMRILLIAVTISVGLALAATLANADAVASANVTPTIVCKAHCDTPEPPAMMTVTPTTGYRLFMVEVRR